MGASDWEYGDRSMGMGAWGGEHRDGSMRIKWDKSTIFDCTVCGTNITKFDGTIGMLVIEVS